MTIHQHLRRFSLVLSLIALPVAGAACSEPDDPSSGPVGAANTAVSDDALSRDATERGSANIAESGTNCRQIAILSNPIAAMHLDDPMRQQTGGRAQLVSFGGGADERLDGTALATIVGKQPSGELLGNHHFLFGNGTLRTKNDVIALMPTSDPCIFDAKVKLFFHDGTGAFAGLSGTGTTEASLNFCGGVGRAPIYARLCEAGK